MVGSDEDATRYELRWVFDRKRRGAEGCNVMGKLLLATFGYWIADKGKVRGWKYEDGLAGTVVLTPSVMILSKIAFSSSLLVSLK